MLRRLIPLLLLPLFFDGAGGTGGGGGTGAMPEGGATPPTPPSGGATPPAGATPEGDKGKADGEPELGEGGQRAIAAERAKAREAEDRAKAAEARLAELETGTQTEHEKALSQSKREARAEADAKWAQHVRNARVQGALQAAGIVNEKFLSLALGAPELASLKVDAESGEVQGVGEAVAAFKLAYPEAFKSATPPPPGGQWDGGAGGGTGKKEPATLEEAIAQQYAEGNKR